MGLDLLVEGRPKPGHEAEWRQILMRSFNEEKPKKGDEDRYKEITIMDYEQVGTPRVGSDPAADAWIIETRQAETPEEIATALEDFRGYYAVALAECDGVPKFNQAAHGYGADETSFRGKFFDFCEDVLTPDLIAGAYQHRFPEDAIAYGRALLAAADAATANGPLPLPPPPPPRTGFFARFLGQPRQQERSDELSFDEQLDVVRTGGKWFLFWGERGNAIRAWV